MSVDLPGVPGLVFSIFSLAIVLLLAKNILQKQRFKLLASVCFWD
jgi:hypothetical protein